MGEIDSILLILSAELYVTYGSAISLNCTGDAFPAVTAKWRTPYSNDFRMAGSPLKIPSFMWMNQNDYICLLDNGVQFPAVRKITLFATEQSPNLLKPNVTEVSVFEGDDITMDCICKRCERPANLWWFYESNENPLISDSITANLTYDQQLKRVAMENIPITKAGIYKCQMQCSRQDCIDEFSIKVNVQKPHTVENMPTNKQFYRCIANEHVEFIALNNSNNGIAWKMFSCRSPLDDKSVNLSIVLLGKLTSCEISICVFYVLFLFQNQI